jgi:diguanylate cyclase (GGDEF)-like protein/PAS domain S-box-containing protein
MKEKYIEKHLDDLFVFWSYRAYIWGAILFVLFSVLDYVSTPENFRVFLYYRINISCVLLLIAFISKRSKNLFIHKILAYVGVVTSAITLELMILQFKGHESPYYVGMILLGIFVLVFISGKISFHITSAVLIYSIYLFPILFTEKITNFQTFFMSNFFMISIFITALILQFLRSKSLINELILKYELESAVSSLKESEQKYRSLVQSTEDSIYLVDKNYRYIFINEKHLKRLGISDEEYMGKTYGDFHTPEDTEKFTSIVKEVFATGKSIQNEYRSRRDGKYFLQTFSPVYGTDGEITAVTVVSKNITRIKQMEQELRSLSLTDELTGLYNRRGFVTLVDQQFKIADRMKKGIFMLYADMDDLKKINDTFGHKEGDAVLIEAANMLRSNYRQSDIIARIGGDEFVVIPVGTSKDSIEVITERFYKSLELYNARGSCKHNLSMSIGVAFYDPESPSTIDELLIRADRMMYEEKKRRQMSQNNISAHRK